MTFTYRKTTKGEMNHGHCGSANNCYYKGNTTIWEIVHDNEGMEEGFTTKRKAEACVDYLNENYPNWDGVGDVIGDFEGFWYSTH